MSESPLFELEPTTVSAGSHVTVQTIWGDEPGVVLEVESGLAMVALGRGDVITISITRLMELEGNSNE